MRDANGILIVVVGFSLITQPDDPMTIYTGLGLLVCVKLFQGWWQLHRRT